MKTHKKSIARSAVVGRYYVDKSGRIRSHGLAVDKKSKIGRTPYKRFGSSVAASRKSEASSLRRRFAGKKISAVYLIRPKKGRTSVPLSNIKKAIRISHISRIARHGG